MLVPSNLRAKLGVTVGRLGNYVGCRKTADVTPIAWPRPNWRAVAMNRAKPAAFAQHVIGIASAK
jgi:hypothetical protein